MTDENDNEEVTPERSGQHLYERWVAEQLEQNIEQSIEQALNQMVEAGELIEVSPRVYALAKRTGQES